MRRLFFLSFILLYLVNFSGTTEKKVKFEPVSVERKNYQVSVRCILQDSRGFLWFGTEDGLNRYDGYTLISYRHNPRIASSISSNDITSLHKDRSGSLWIGTYGGGLNKFDWKKETFIHYRHDPYNPSSLSSNNVSFIYEDRSDTLWIGTISGGLNKLIPDDNRNSHPTFKSYKHDVNNPNSLSSNMIYSIIEDSFGNLWIGTDGGGLNKLDKENDTFIRYQHDHSDPESLNGYSVLEICEDSSGNLWIGTERGLNKLRSDLIRESRPTFLHFEHNPQNPNSLSWYNVNSIHEDQAGSLWVGTSGGLNELIFNNDAAVSPIFVRYLRNLDDRNSLRGNIILTIYEDHSGTLWIGTGDGGICRLSREREKFNHHIIKSNTLNREFNNLIRSFFEDKKGDLWIGTVAGLNKWNRKTNKFTQCLIDNEAAGRLTDNHIRSICESKSEGLWIGSFGGGIIKLISTDIEKSPPVFIHYRTGFESLNRLSSTFVRIVYEDRRENLWIGTNEGGLIRAVLSKPEGSPIKYIRYLHDPEIPNSISGNAIRSIYEDKSDNLWIGTHEGGLNKYDPENDSFISYKNEPDNPQSLSNNCILSIYEDSRDDFWIGTLGGGLNKFDRKNKTFTHYDEEDGLPSNVVYGILEDSQSILWLSTNNGLSTFNPQTERFNNYYEEDGIQDNEFNGGAYLKSKNGEMFFGGINGFNAFFPEKIEINPYIPPIVITDFHIIGKSNKLGSDSGLKKTITKAEEIKLSPKDSSFSIQFAALDYSHPERNQYSYKMEGLDDQWTYLGHQRLVDFDNLDPGKYTFRVKGSNNDGVWNEEGTYINIIITSSLWRRGWFLALAALLFTTLVYLGYKVSRRYPSYRFSDKMDLSPFISKYKLSKREQDLLILILKGKQNKDIQKELHISESTVKKHIYSIYRKLHVKNRLQVIYLIQSSRMLNNANDL